MAATHYDFADDFPKVGLSLMLRCTCTGMVYRAIHQLTNHTEGFAHCGYCGQLLIPDQQLADAFDAARVAGASPSALLGEILGLEPLMPMKGAR